MKSTATKPKIEGVVRGVDLAEVKAAAIGRWPDILSHVGGIDPALLNGRHHPCPKCGGKDRFRAFTDGSGGAICNQCFNKKNGDGLATIQWLLNCDFTAALNHVADYLGVRCNGNGHAHRPDLLTIVCRQKRMPIESARAYGTQETKRGKCPVVRFPVCNERGEIHSYFDLSADNGKGWFKKGKGASGLFLPIADNEPRLPEAGETWILTEGGKDPTVYHAHGYLACGLPTDNLAIKYARLFRGCHVVVMPDRTADAEEKAQRSAARLHGVAASVRVGVLPLELGGDKGDDARDVLKMRGGENLLRQAIADAVEFQPPETEPGDDWQAGRQCTDYGNAERFVQQHGASVRFCFAWKKWLVWDGRRWAIDETGAVIRLAKQTVRSLLQEAADANDSDERERIAKWAIASEKAERITALLKLAQSESEMPITPAELDAAPWLLNVENGTLDLTTGELRKPNRGDYLTTLAPVEYPDEPGVDCPLWQEFLDQIFDGNVALIQFIQRLLGYSLVGAVYEHILPIFYGTGANGKSVLIETVLGVLGPDYAMKAPHNLLMTRRNESHPTERADLFGKRFVAAVETDHGRRIAEALVKELTGGDRIRARRLYENHWEFTPSHTAVLVTNHKPDVRGDDHGIWRRLRLVPFAVTIPPSEQDSRLTEKLRAEGGAILRWLVAGCLGWQRDGLQEPDEVTTATSGYRGEQDVLTLFFDEACVRGQGYKVRAGAIYKAYASWCNISGEDSMSQRQFGVAMTEREFQRKSNNGTWYLGIGLRDDDTEPTEG